MSEQNISGIAREAVDWFETATRPDGESTFVRLKDGAPEWISELVREAHGEFLPDDWRYEAIRSALEFISEVEDDPESMEHEWADANVDVYTADRFTWLSSNLNRQGYVDEAVREYGSDSGIVDNIGLGQYMESREVFASVFSSLEECLEVSAEVGS